MIGEADAVQLLIDEAWVAFGENRYERAAYKGLAWCALANDDPTTARRHAADALRLAEPLGANALCTPLEVLVAACQAAGDLDGAWQAATRHLDAAGQVGGHVRPYYATRDAVDVALDRADLDTARQLLVELDSHATALDANAGTTAYAGVVALRHDRVARLAEETS